MLKNISDQTIRFTIDGTEHTAAPYGEVTPRVPEHKEASVLRISGLPVRIDGPVGASAPVAPPPYAPTLSLPPTPGSTTSDDAPSSDALPKTDVKPPELAKADAKDAKPPVKPEAKVDTKTETAKPTK